MKLSDASSSVRHQDNARYIARIPVPLNADGIRRIQKCVQEYTRDHSRVLVAPTRCLGVLHRRGTDATLLSDVNLSDSDGIALPLQTMQVSKIKVQPGDVIVFSLLPGGSQLMRSFYRGMVKDWASDLIVEEVEWCSWIALAIAIRLSVNTGN